MPRRDPYDFSHIPQSGDPAKAREIAERLAQERHGVPLSQLEHAQSRALIEEAEALAAQEEPPSRAATPYDDEWANYKDLTYVLLRQAVPVERIDALVNAQEIRTIEDLASLNAELLSLADEFAIPRPWLLKQLERKKRTRASRQIQEEPTMSWLTKKADDGPEFSHKLPTKARPDIGGPVDEGGLPGLPGLSEAPKAPAAGPMGLGGPKPAPRPSAKPPMGGMPPKAPGGKPAPGLDEIKMLLDKGDLQAALESLKKLLPGGGDKSPAPPHKHPQLGKPKEDGGDKVPAKPAPKAAPMEGEDKDKKEEKGKDASASRHIMVCGSCSVALEAHCQRCDGPLTPTAESAHEQHEKREEGEDEEEKKEEFDRSE